MNRHGSKIPLFAVLPIFAVLLVVGNVGTSDAARVVCGLQLCADLPDGGNYVMELDEHVSGSGNADKMMGDAMMDGDHMKDKHMKDDRMMDGDHMKDKHMKDDRMKDKHMKDDRMMDDDHMKDKHMKDDRMMDGDHMKDDRMMDGDHMKDKHMKDDRMMDDDHMKDGHMKDKYSKKLHLSRASVPATIPMHQGYYDGDSVYYIITDSSEPTHAEIITEQQGWKVELAPPLQFAPESALSQTYMFTNGIEGDGVHGFQGEVFTSTPATPETYSALTAHTHVAWNADATPRVLTSQSEIMAASDAGEVTLIDLDVVLNMPHIKWPGGELPLNTSEINDKTPYGGGQVTEINTDEMTVTFVAHRGWGPDGRSIYYIVTDATPAGPAEGMGVAYTPTSANLLANAAAVDLFQFTNGLKGPGPLGFQPGIATAALGDEGYSPMWRISVVTWDEPKYASLLLTIDDINTMRSEGNLTTQLARPMDSDHIVNCPFIDPFQ